MINYHCCLSHPYPFAIQQQSSGGTPPNAPTNLVAIAATGNGNSVSLDWDDTPTATSYNVYRGTASGGEVLLNTSATSDYIDNTAVNWVLYYYRVTAVNAFGESAVSNEVTARPEYTTNLYCWLNANTLGLNDTDPVTTWNDDSGNGNSPTQATSSKKPTFRTGIINGNPAVLFDGVDDFLLFTFAAKAQPYTWVFAGMYHGAGFTRVYIDSSGGVNRAFAIESSGNVFAIGAVSTQTVHANSPDVFHVMEAFYSGGSSYGIWDNIKSANFAAGTNATDGIRLGINTALASPLDRYIGEVLLYSAAIPAQEETNLYNYLHGKWQ